MARFRDTVVCAARGWRWVGVRSFKEIPHRPAVREMLGTVRKLVSRCTELQAAGVGKLGAQVDTCLAAVFDLLGTVSRERDELLFKLDQAAKNAKYSSVLEVRPGLLFLAHARARLPATQWMLPGLCRFARARAAC